MHTLPNHSVHRTSFIRITIRKREVNQAPPSAPFPEMQKSEREMSRTIEFRNGGYCVRPFQLSVW